MYPCVNRARTPLVVWLIWQQEPATFPLHFGKGIPFPRLQTPQIVNIFSFHYVPAQCLTFSVIPVVNALPWIIGLQGRGGIFSEVSVVMFLGIGWYSIIFIEVFINRGQCNTLPFTSHRLPLSRVVETELLYLLLTILRHFVHYLNISSLCYFIL